MRKEWKYLIAGIFIMAFRFTIADGFLYIFPPVAGWGVIYFSTQRIYEERQGEWKYMKLLAGGGVFLTGALELLRLCEIYDYLTEFAWVVVTICELVFFYRFTREYVKRRYISYDAVTGYLAGMIGAAALMIVGITLVNSFFVTVSSVVIVGERIWLVALLWKSAKYELEDIEWAAYYQKIEKENAQK